MPVLDVVQLHTRSVYMLCPTSSVIGAGLTRPVIIDDVPSRPFRCGSYHAGSFGCVRGAQRNLTVYVFLGANTARHAW